MKQRLEQDTPPHNLLDPQSLFPIFSSTTFVLHMPYLHLHAPLARTNYSAVITPKMTPRRSLSTVPSILRNPLKRTGRVGRVALQQSLLRHLQTASIAHVARVTTERNPCVLAEAQIPPLPELGANQKLEYLSVYFQVDKQRAKTAYTFTMAKGED